MPVAYSFTYTILLLFLGLLFLKFLARLPCPTRWSFVLGGIVFLSGAAGLEMAGGQYSTQGWAIDGSDKVDFHYALIITLEEPLEMLGIVIFFYALMRYYLKEITEHAFLFTIRDPD